MDFEAWKGKKSYTIGSELEVRLLDNDTYELKEISSQVLPDIPQEIQGNVHQEFLECMLEFVTPVCKSATEITGHLKNYLHVMQDLEKKYGFVFATSGSHALKINPLKNINIPRYNEFAKEYGILLKKFHICGFHIHVGFENSNEALHVYNYMLDKLPLFLALSANSAFFDGADTSLLSYRTQLFAQLPRAGVPSYFDSFEELQKMYEDLKNCKMIESASDLWWDLRISPKFGTVEIRICDASSDFERLEDLVNFYQALCLYARTQTIEKLPMQVLYQNKWNAARHGFDGVYQNSFTCKSFQELFLELMSEMKEAKVFDTLGINPLHVNRLENRANEKTEAHRQREIYNKTKDLKEVEKLGVL